MALPNAIRSRSRHALCRLFRATRCPYQRIKRKVILLPALLGLCAVSWFSYKSAENALDAQISQNFDLLAAIEASQLDRTTALLRVVLKNAASIARLRNFLKAGSDEERASLRTGMQQALKSLSTDFSLFADVALVAPDGVVAGHTSAKGVGMNVAERFYFRESMQGKSATLNTKSKAT